MKTQQEVNDWVLALPPADREFAETIFTWAYRAGAKDALARIQAKVTELNTAFPDPERN